MLAVSLSRRHIVEARKRPGVRISLWLARFGLLYPALSRSWVTSQTVTRTTVAAGDGVKF